MSDVITGVGQVDAIPQPNSDPDYNVPGVSSEDWFVFSRIDGKVTVQALLSYLGLSRDRVVQSLRKLRQLGLIMIPGYEEEELEGVEPATGPFEFPEEWTIPYGKFVFDFELLEGRYEIPVEKREEILYMHYYLDRVDFYSLLGLSSDAPKKDVRRAYFQLSKMFHPDNFFRRDIGPFHQMVEEIFSTVSKAAQILMNPSDRAQYDRMFEAAKQQEQNKLSKTGKRYVMTVPHHTADVRTQATRRERWVSTRPSQSVNTLLERARRHTTLGRFPEAAVLYKMIAERLNDDKVLHEAAQCLLKADISPLEARRLAERAVVLGGEKVEHLLTLALTQEHLRDLDGARSTYNRVLDIDEDNPVARLNLERIDS